MIQLYFPYTERNVVIPGSPLHEIRSRFDDDAAPTPTAAANRRSDDAPTPTAAPTSRRSDALAEVTSIVSKTLFKIKLV